MSRFLTQISYVGKEQQPIFRFSDGGTYSPLGRTLSLSFDLTQRYCIGWHDISTGDSHPCPENATIDKKFETCPACQKRTGFNPAFYHSVKVSQQQEARNAEPHRLYLAIMGNGYIKVGISWDKRGNNRLLDQGARAGIILEVFPTALIARQYEAKIAQLSDIHETTSTRTKLALLATPFNTEAAEQQLKSVKQRIEESLAVSFSGQDILFFDTHYTETQVPFGEITTLPTPPISGTTEALIGDILLTNYDNRILALPLKQYIGYMIEVSDKLLPLDLEPQQMQLL